MFWFLVLILVVAFYFEIKRLRLSWRFRSIPGPREYPFIGSKYALFPNEISDIIRLGHEVQRGKLAKLFVGPKMVLLVADPGMMKDILTNSKDCVERPYPFEFLRLNHGLTASKKHWWKPLRKGLNVSFSQQIVNGLVPMFDQYFREMVLSLQAKVGAPAFNIQVDVADALFGSICHTILEEVVEQGFSAGEVEELEDLVSQRIINGLYHLDIIYERTQPHRREMKIRDKMASVLLKILNRKRMEMAKVEYEETKKCLERLLVMKINEKHLNDVQLIENLVNLLIGGFDTSSSALCYTVLAFALYPEIQRRAHKEIDEVFGGALPAKLSHEDLKRMTYLETCIFESMRHFPPIPVSARETTADVIIGPHRIPKDTILGLNFFFLHRSEEVWGPTTDTFNPDRFRSSEDRHPYSFLPFSSGSRNCIGERYGLAAVKVGLIHLLKNFRFTTPLCNDDLTFKFSITLKLNCGHMVQIHRRP